MKTLVIRSLALAAFAMATVVNAEKSSPLAEEPAGVVPDVKALERLEAVDPACASPDHFRATADGFLAVEFGDAEWQAHLPRYYAALTPDEKAVLGAALASGEALTIVTAACSPNDVLWTHLAWRFYLRPTREGLPADLARAPALRAFQVEEGQRAALSALLAAADAVQ